MCCKTATITATVVYSTVQSNRIIIGLKDQRKDIHLQRSLPRRTECHRTARSVPADRLSPADSCTPSPGSSRSLPGCGECPQCAGKTDCRDCDLHRINTPAALQCRGGGGRLLVVCGNGSYVHMWWCIVAKYLIDLFFSVTATTEQLLTCCIRKGSKQSTE